MQGFNAQQLLRLPLYASPSSHKLSPEQLAGSAGPYAFIPAIAFGDADKRVACFPARPPPDVKGQMWIIFVPPYRQFGHDLDTVFLCGETLNSARFVAICKTGDKAQSVHVNWPRLETLSRRRHVQCKVHRILGFTFLYNQNTWHMSPYHPKLIVHHRDDRHSNSQLRNLEIMTSTEHDRLSRKRKRGAGA